MYKASIEEYRDACERIARFISVKNEWPDYVTVPKGKEKFTAVEARNAMTRVNNFLNKEKRYPETVIFGSFTPAPTVPPTASTCADNKLKVGCKGDNVEILQNWLKSKGYYKGTVDGDFGQVTADAVKAFQKQAGITIDGWWGDECIAAKAKLAIPSSCFEVPSYSFRYQPDKYTCGPASTEMALSELGVHVYVTDIAKYEGTTIRGTGHDGIKAGIAAVAKETKTNLTFSEAYFSDTGWAKLGQLLKDPTVAVICHGHTSGWRSYYDGDYGHYVYPVKICLDQKKIWIADPARGVITYSLDEFLKGLNKISQPSLLIIKRV